MGRHSWFFCGCRFARGGWQMYDGWHGRRPVRAQRSIHRGFPVFAPWRIEFDAVDVRSLFAH